MSFQLEKFFFDTPLYTKVVLTKEEISSKEFDGLFTYFSSRDIEGYNPIRKTHSTFSIYERISPDIIHTGGLSILILNCKRYNDKFYFYLYWDSKTSCLTKIGQYPTVADFHLSEVKQYTKVIHQERLKEFTRAIGLAANGVGIGSFVYLRRIFESLINEAYEKALIENVITEELFQKSRMAEKIDLLHSFLPSFLVENRGMYSILSLGIHELDEDTCLAHFDTLRVGIEIILDEKLEALQKAAKIESAKQKLSSLKGQLKK